MEECGDYHCAQKRLESEWMVAPCYIIITGTKENEGVVLSRNRTHTINVRNISDDNWYLVQTNDDTYTGQCRERCQNATQNLNDLTREKAATTTVFDKVLNVAPNLNYWSVYASVMVPKTGLFMA